MRAVAKRLALGIFASAPVQRPGLGDLGLERQEVGAFVRAIAVRLGLGLAARAPPIGAGFNF